MDLQDWRDIVIIVAGVLMALVLVTVFIVTVVVGIATRTLLKTIQTLLKAEVTPLLDSARQSLENVRGTTAFIGQNVVAPVIRVYGVVAGARRAFGVLSGVKRRGNRSE